MRRFAPCLLAVCCAVAQASSLRAQESSLTLAQLVEPSTVFRSQDQTVLFGLHWFIEFETLEDLFSHIDEQCARWEFDSPQQRQAFGDDLLRRGTESRVISMQYELPREILVTHTAEELAESVESVPTKRSGLIYRGEHWSLDVATYRDVLLRLQERWRSALNCWSASPSIPARVLSNWYLIEEGITLFGASYDSTEHFWQAVKYHPDTGLGDLSEVLGLLRSVSWAPWVETLASDQATYLEHGYAVEFLRHNLSPQRLDWFDAEVARYASQFDTPEFDTPVRQLQQRTPGKLRFTALDEKILWGDLADVFHLLYFFSHGDYDRFRTAEMEPALEAISRHHFDGIYLSGYADGKMAFVSPEFRQLMLEIWKVKFLELERFREVIRSTKGTRLLHFLNDGTSPDIPIPAYVAMLEEIRELALREPGEHYTRSESAKGSECNPEDCRGKGPYLSYTPRICPILCEH